MQPIYLVRPVNVPPELISRRLSGRVVAISNCDTPIGQLIVQELVECGAKVVAGSSNPNFVLENLSTTDNAEIVHCHPTSFDETRNLALHISSHVQEIDNLIFIPPLSNRARFVSPHGWSIQLAHAMALIPMLTVLADSFSDDARIITILGSLSLSFSESVSYLSTTDKDYDPNIAVNAAAYLLVQLMHFYSQTKGSPDNCTFLPKPSASNSEQDDVPDTAITQQSRQDAAKKIAELIAAEPKWNSAIVEQDLAISSFITSIAGGASNLEEAVAKMLNHDDVLKTVQFIRETIINAYPDYNLSALKKNGFAPNRGKHEQQ